MTANETTLAHLGDERIAEMEEAVFARIAADRAYSDAPAANARRRAAGHGRWWVGGAAAAALVAVAAFLAPQVLSGLSGQTSAGSLAVAPAADFAAEGGVADLSAGAESGVADAAAEREIAVTASATVEVADTAVAAAAIGDAAEAAGGYVETMSVGGASLTGPATQTDMYAPMPVGTWITVRVPADRLSETLADLSGLGTVTSSQIDRRDVTTEAVDLRARVAALESSVSRLTKLLAQSASTADLIAAESALSERQSELDSLRQQLILLDGQVELSSAMITLTEPVPTIAPDPAGFRDGIVAGWNGLVAASGGIVVGIGFLLPWLAVAALAALTVWGVRRALRQKRARSSDSASA